jgi:PAS domain S-box-containing protein
MSQTTHFPPSDVAHPGARAGRPFTLLRLQVLVDRLLWAERPLAMQLLPGIAAVAATTAVETYIPGGMERGSALFAFFPAIVVGSLFGRLTGGLLSLLLSIVLVCAWIVPFQGGLNLAELFPYTGACLTVILLTAALYQAHGRAFAAARESAEYQTVAAALAEREARLNAVLEGVADGIVTIDGRGTIKSANHSVTSIFGYKPEDVEGASINMLMPVECRESHDYFMAAYIESGQMNAACRRRFVEGRRKDGSLFPMECSVSDILSDDGRLFVGIVRDITERKEAEDAIQASAEFSRTVLESSGDCILVMDCAGRIEYVNGPGLRLLESGSETITGKLWMEMWPDSERAAVEEAIAKANAGETYRFSAYQPTAKGTPKCWDVLAAPVRDSGGEISKVVATVRDITEAKETEKQIKFLMQEVNHRSKNLFAVVQAVTRQIGSGEENKNFAGRLGERLAALAKSYDLLVKNEWRGVSAGELVESQLAHFKDLIGARVFLEGPPAQLTPAAAQSLGMALHELSTNASKYGALSNSEGVVRVSWAIAQQGDRQYFRMRWAEEGGPPTVRPERRGFGRTVLVKLAGHALGAKVILDFPPSGLVWVLSAETAAVLEPDEPQAIAS